MEETSDTTSDNCQSLAPIAQIDPSRKRQKTSAISTLNSQNDNEELSSAAIRKQKNEDSCQLYKLSNDELKLIFGYVGEDQYRFVACVSCKFHQVYLTTFGGKTLTSIVNAVASVSCAAVCLHSEESGCDGHVKSLFNTAAKEGKVEILIWRGLVTLP